MKANELLGASVAALFGPDEFHRRHIGPSIGEETQMLAAIGYTSRHELIADTVPAAILLSDSKAEGASAHGSPLSIGEPVTEAGALAELAAIAGTNQVWRSYIGAGYHNTITPEPIRRNVLENPGWYTAYTPYQPEISQGRLEALLNFQTMIAELTGMDLANASLLDEATAAAEAMALCRRVTKRDSATFFVDAECHPQTIEVVATRAEPLGITITVGDPVTGLDGIDAYGVLGCPSPPPSSRRGAAPCTGRAPCRTLPSWRASAP